MALPELVEQSHLMLFFYMGFMIFSSLLAHATAIVHRLNAMD
jgi:hypothetical protein